ncbi:Reverse transcriptase domain [Lasallia pustulata]|uniref:Reverse transcriptase domain n=1 Tax=Lasallia pustulata TaxID=136370 RepID=A0A1W5D6J4_9LECA|nr:Reverse transcriptase domain [Lasallia pustulata]
MSTTGSTQGGSRAAAPRAEVVTTKSLKLATPTIFTGDRKKLDTFLSQLALYFKFNSSSFVTDADKIQYAAYYLQGEAEEWFRPYIQEYTDNEDNPSQAEESTRRMFASCNRSKSEIRIVFGDIDRERTAERELMQLRQTKSAADYTMHFMRLSTATNWEDAALMAMFYAGLKDAVKDEIARGERLHDLWAVTTMAIRIDNRLYERRKEKGQTAYSDEQKTAAYMSGHKRNKNWHHRNDKYGPRPMEIDTIKLKKKKTFDGDCYNCGKNPEKQPIYPISEAKLEVLRKYIDENKVKGFIRKSTSPVGYPILFVQKKDGTQRLYVNYRKLNAITVKNSYPLPLISELQDRLQKAKWFTKLDVRQAYHQIQMKAGEEWKTAFRTRLGHFEYRVIPFGLTNTPASFQSYINNVLREYLDVFATVYINDILIYSETEEEHRTHVRKVLTASQMEDLQLSLEKSEFHKQEINFLGYIIRPGELGMDPNKVTAIQEWPEPKTVKEVQVFLGFANFYRRFIERVTNGVETDASDGAFGACLGQQKDKKLVPVAFYSQELAPAELNYKIHDKELLAIVDALKQWRVYLEGSKTEVKVYSDHKNLESFTTTKLIREALTKDKAMKDLCTPNQEPGSLFEDKDGILWFNGKCYVPKSARDWVIRTCHDDRVQGHQGIKRTLDKVATHWYIPRARHEVEEYIQKCDKCQGSKHARHAPYERLQPVPTINQPWKMIAFNFIMKLPVSQEPMTQQYYDTILVVTNKLTKYGKFVPYLEGSSAEELAYAFYKYVVTDHGLPTQIILDRDKLVVRPFHIKKALGPEVYKLELPKSMKIHPVFHITVLELAHPSIPVATQVLTLETDNNDKEYVVEKVLQSQLVDGQLQYLVKWKGYSMNNNMWEPASQFTSKKVLQDFHRHHPEQPRTIMPQGNQEIRRRGQVEQRRSDP